MNFKTRLKQLRNERGISQRQLAEFWKVAPSTISMYENGQREPNFEVLESLADFFNVDLNYLLGKTNKTTKIILDSKFSKGIKIPVLGTVPAGIPITAVEDIIDYEEIPKSWENQGEFFGLKIKGDSMYPTLENGDDATCKRYERSDNGIMLIPNNNAYNPVFYTNEEIEALPLTIIGKVVELRRKF